MVRGIRGATTCDNTAASIEEAVEELTLAMMRENDVFEADIACMVYSATSDIDAVFPASCARKLGLADVAFLDVQEMAKPGGIDHCIRALMLVNTDKRQDEIRFVYLGGAVSLRPDKVGK